MSETTATFSIGQLVHHAKFDYRGVVFDVDPVFSGSEEWYEQVTRSHPPRDRPWYHVLPDGTSHATYVAERHLEADTSDLPIRHPALSQFFETQETGRYIPRRTAS